MNPSRCISAKICSILLIEQIDRLTRLSNSDWMTLKKQIEQHELRIISLDVSTSWQALSDKNPSQVEPLTRAVITAIINMLIVLIAAMSHKDCLILRQQQKQGIERAHTLGVSKLIRTSIRKSCTTGRSRNSVSGKQRMQRDTGLPRYAAFRRCTDNQWRVILVKS